MAEREAPELAAGGALDVKERSFVPPAQDAGFDRMVRSAVGDLQSDSAATRKTLDASREKSANLLTRLEASDKERPAPPDIPPPAAAPKHQAPTDALQSFGSAASVLALFGALASRRPLTAALNASAAGMKAIQERDAEAFEREHKIWKEQSEYAGQLAQWNLDRYNATLANWKGTQEGLFGQLRAISQLDQDTLAQHAMKTGDLQVVEKFLADRQAQIERYQNYRLDLDKFSETQKNHMFEHEDRQVRNEILRTSAGGDPNSVEEVAKQISEYRMAPLSAFALKSGFGQKVMARVSELNPDYQSTRYNEVNRAVTAFGSGKQGDTVRSFNVAIAHLNTLDELTDALSTGDVKALNAVGNIFQEQFGGTAPNNFNAAKDIVGQEVTKAIVGQVGTGAERQGLSDKFNAAKTVEQLHEVIGTTKKLMAGQLIGLRKQYEDSTGLKNFDEKLLPQTREALSGKDKGAEKKSQPVPAAYKNKPDGTVLYDAEGRAYQKHGDVIELM